MSSSVRFGLYNAAAAIGFTLLLYITGLNRTDNSQLFSMIGMIFPIIFMYKAILHYRMNEGHGFISFGKAFREAFKVGVIGGLLNTLFFVVYIKFIDPTYVEHLSHMQEVALEEKGMSPEMIEQQMVYVNKFMTPMWMFIWGAVMTIFFAAVLATIMAGILKKPNPEEIA